MPIPAFQQIIRPLLVFAEDGSEKSRQGAVQALASHFNLTEEERDQLLPSGTQALFTNRVNWARTYLDKAGALRRTRRAHFVITDRGKKLLAEHPDYINVKILRQFPEFVAFHAPKATGENDAPAVSEDVETQQSTATPEEAILEAESQIVEALKSQILERIAGLSPAFFESLVVDLIVAMGYGGTRSNVVQRLGKSGDQGIDGIVNEDPLGLDVVYLQAKRYAVDNTISREQIQQFAGALVGQGASKGVFVTTSQFSKGAIDYADKVPQRIILIDREKLTQLMVQYGVGVRVERTVQIMRIDTDFFSDDED